MPSGELIPTVVPGFGGACSIGPSYSVHLSSHLVLEGADGVLVACYPAVGGAEPSDDPAIFTADWISLMVCWSLVAPAPVLDDLGLGEEEIFISVRSFFIVWYCVEVVAASRALASVSCNSVRPLLVAASAIRLR